MDETVDGHHAHQHNGQYEAPEGPLRAGRESLNQVRAVVTEVPQRMAAHNEAGQPETCHPERDQQGQSKAKDEEGSDDVENDLENAHADAEQAVHATALDGRLRPLGVRLVNNGLGKVLRRHTLSIHTQPVFRRACLRHEQPQHHIDQQRRTKGQEAQTHDKQTPNQRVAAKIVGKARHDTAEHLVVRVTEELFLRLSAALRSLATAESLPGAIFGLTGHLFRLAQARNNVLHMLNGDGLHALGLQFLKQVGHAALNVVGNLLAVGLAREIGAQIVLVTLQQFVSVLIYGVKRAIKIDGNILFHLIN